MTSKRLSLIFIGALFQSIILAQSYTSETIQYDGETREYQLYVPAIYDGTSKVPLVFNFHGGGGDIDSQIKTSDLGPIADVANFIAVYPQALPDPNDGGSTNWLRKEPSAIDDVFFIDALIDSIALEYQIELNRVYACGYSLGGEFTFELACRLNDRIAAIGVVARTMQAWTLDQCSPVHPTGVLTILGTEDFISSYEGVFFGGVQYYLSADEVNDYWVEKNECNDVPEFSDVPDINFTDGSTVERYIWSDADDCKYIEHLKVVGGGHDWPGSFGNMDIDATQEIWDFVSLYDLNGLIGCTTSSLDENINAQLTIQAYPNPFRNLLTLETQRAETIEATIYSIQGDLLLTMRLESDVTHIDLSSLSAGVYVIKFEDQVLKVIKGE